ncbi:MAG: efflux RND transporter periplasmic adaptor subunit [Alphaproteobacteria bacterium]|nr:efflux RND transporter periplasmic adaptor subunit [Alphaproteobacteria bacterium]
MSPRTILFGAVAGAALLAAGAGGYFLGHRGGSAETQTASSAPTPLYWVSSMDPSYRRDKPGKDSMGMDLVPVYASAGAAASDVTISPAVVQQLSVQTAAVREGPLARRIEAVGYVGYDEDLVTSINTRADGWIEKLHVKAEGDAVRKGELLYELFSPKLATAEQEYLTALASNMPSLIGASRERLLALGFAPDQIRELARRRKTSDRVARYAEQSGVVASLGVREGAYVMPATQVMKIAELSSVWVLVEVDESDTAALKTGQSVTARFEAFPGEVWTGTIDYIYPDLVSATRTVKLRLRFANTDYRLQPNMYAHVTIDSAPQNAVYIPASALIRTGQSERVALALGQGRFDICPVVAGFQTGGDVEILKGLRVGQRVVVSSQFLIDSEANVDEASLRISGGKPACRASSQAPAPMNMPMNMKMPPGAPPMKMPAGGTPSPMPMNMPMPAKGGRS